MSRKLAREIAFKIVFSSNFKFEDELENPIQEEENYKTVGGELLDNIVADKELIFQEDQTDGNDEVTEEDRKYISQVTRGIEENIEKLDEIIKPFLKGWTMERIGKTDLAILRLAVYEIIFRDDIPYKVSINEAVELAKIFCEDNSPSFINGVLAGVISSLDNKN